MEELLKGLQTKNGIAPIDAEWLPQFVQHWRTLSEAERKAMVQLEDIRSKLIDKETELSLLQADIRMLSVDRDNKIVEMETLMMQLQQLRDDNEFSLGRIQSVESELEDLRLKNAQLSEELFIKSEKLKNLDAMQMSVRDDREISEKQKKINELESLSSKLKEENHKFLEQSRKKEIQYLDETRVLQKTLDEALDQKVKAQKKSDRDLAEAQASNSALMDDFEWKLRQIESSCKKKLQEKDGEINDKLKHLRIETEKEFAKEKAKLQEERGTLEEQIKKVAHLKSYEAEVVQLRGLTQEQMKSLRAAARQLEQYKCNEKNLQEELVMTHKLLNKEKSHFISLRQSNDRRLEIESKNLQSVLDKQKKDLTAYWEDRMKTECERLTNNLTKTHAQEKEVVVAAIKSEKEKELSTSKLLWERKNLELSQEISKLKEKIVDSESKYQREIERATTVADRESCDLRRKFDKMSNAHLEQLDELKKSHSEEMDALMRRYDASKTEIEELNKKIKHANKNAESLEDSDSESGDNSSEEESDDDDDTRSKFTECVSTTSKSIDNLREEVASLQGSIEKLTSDLTQTKIVETNGKSCSSETESTSGRDTGSTSPESSSDLPVPTLLMTTLIPILIYILSQSYPSILLAVLLVCFVKFARSRFARSDDDE